MALPLFNATWGSGLRKSLKIVDENADSAYMLKWLDPGDNVLVS